MMLSKLATHSLGSALGTAQRDLGRNVSYTDGDRHHQDRGQARHDRVSGQDYDRSAFVTGDVNEPDLASSGFDAHSASQERSAHTSQPVSFFVSSTPTRRRTLWYNDLMPRFARNVAWAPAGYGLAIALSGVALVRAWRPERSTVDVAVTAATPWLLAPS